MKNKLQLKSIIAATTLSAFSAITAYAQTNLGADCGCPPVASRPNVLLSTLALSGGSTDGNLSSNNTLLSCDKTYILDKKIFVPNGKSLTISPGTVIKGRKYSTQDSAVSLIVSRGGKIYANGSESCQIVFTAEADPLDGSYPLGTTGQWGGLVLAGRASNNLRLAINGPFVAGGSGKLAVADGLGIFEGFAANDSRLWFGADLNGTQGAAETFDDKDNSGILKYVSVRHSGAILQVGGEVNGITLGSVGSGTTLDHLEVVSCNDDNVEFFGGNVNLKYASFLFGNDDWFDWDLGYSGKSQFLFGHKSSTADTLTAKDTDNGFEMDSDDNKSNATLRSHPIVYNATFIANNKRIRTADNQGMAGISAKELTEGEIYNSIFANFKYGFNAVKTPGTRTGGYEAYHNWRTTSGSPFAGLLIIKNNTFVSCGRAIAFDRDGTAAVNNGDSTQFFTTDGNVSVASVPGFDFTWSMNASNNVVSDKFDAVPNPSLTSTITPSADGFFTQVNYRGAFASTGKNWLSGWAYTQLLNVTTGIQPCPTDINLDGVTDNVDFLELLGKFGQSCQ